MNNGSWIDCLCVILMLALFPIFFSFWLVGFTASMAWGGLYRGWLCIYDMNSRLIDSKKV